MMRESVTSRTSFRVRSSCFVLLMYWFKTRRTARRMQNSTQLRGIHQGLVTFANSNKNNFAGLNSQGSILANTDTTTGSSGIGSFVQSRYWILLTGDYFTPEYAISPSETSNVTEWVEGNAVLFGSTAGSEKNYSYAMLQLVADNTLAFQAFALRPL